MIYKLIPLQQTSFTVKQNRDIIDLLSFDLKIIQSSSKFSSVIIRFILSSLRSYVFYMHAWICISAKNHSYFTVMLKQHMIDLYKHQMHLNAQLIWKFTWNKDTGLHKFPILNTSKPSRIRNRTTPMPLFNDKLLLPPINHKKIGINMLPPTAFNCSSFLPCTKAVIYKAVCTKMKRVPKKNSKALAKWSRSIYDSHNHNLRTDFRKESQ